MDKRVIFAVAGSGKTTHIINKLDESERVLILTYTISNYEHIRRSILRKFGYFPTSIYLETYFSFLYSFCLRPLLDYDVKTKGLLFEPNPPRYASGIARYITSSGYIYANRAAKLIDFAGLDNALFERIEKYFKTVYIDEVQDFAGHDFNLLKMLSAVDVNILMVGDFYQHTFDTSRDGNVNSKLHDNIRLYEEGFRKMALEVDKATLNKSHRCSPETCTFIANNLNIPIDSARIDKTALVVLDTVEKAKKVLFDTEVVKLFYRAHSNYRCFSRNWGECKGEDSFNDVCVVLNPTTYKAFNKDRLSTLSPQTKNKLYVACSRARGDLYFVSEKLIEQCLD